MHIPYTILRGNTFYYNRRLEDGFLRLSLRTTSSKKALVVVVQLNAIVEPMEISKTKLAEIRKAANSWLQRNLDYELVQEAIRPPVDSADLDTKQREQNERNISALKDAKAILMDREHHTRFETSSKALSQEYTLQLNDEELKVLSYHVAQANHEFYQRVLSKQLCSTNFGGRQAFDDGNDRHLSQLVVLYVKRKEKDVAKATLNKINNHLAAMLELTGDIPISRFKREQALQLMDVLFSYPANRRVRKNAEMTLEQLHREGAKSVTPATVKDMHNKISSFFKWCVDMEFTHKNYLEGLAPTGKSTESDRRAWTKNELNTLFSYKVFQGEAEKDWQYWLPIMGISTGARIEELCTLRGSDVRYIEGVLIIDINTIVEGQEEQAKIESEGGKKRVKTVNAPRIVPVHNYLIELGFESFAKSRGEALLFPDLLNYSTAQIQLGKRPSNWFGKLKRDTLKLHPDVTFHSFRHSVANMLSDVMAGAENIRAICGWAQEGTSHKAYIPKISPAVLNCYVQKMPIEAILKDVKRPDSRSVS